SISGTPQTRKSGCDVSTALYMRQRNTLGFMPHDLKEVETLSLPYVSYSLTRVRNLRQWVSDDRLLETAPNESSIDTEKIQLPKLNSIIDDFSSKGTRVNFTMAKGGVGKTSLAS